MFQINVDNLNRMVNADRKTQQDATVYQKHTVHDNVQQLHVRQPSMYAKPEAASAVLGS